MQAPRQHVEGFLGQDRAEVALDVAEGIRRQVGDGAQAALERLCGPGLGGFDERGAAQQAGARIQAHCLLELLRQRNVVAVLRGHAQPHRGLALELEALEGEFQRQCGAVGQGRERAERVPGPAALCRRDQRALERGVAAAVEQVHQRLAQQVARLRMAKELAPGRIDVDDDPFLDVRDRVGRAGHERAHLVAVLARGGKRAVQRVIEPRGREFACRNRLQAAAGVQRHHVRRAEFEAAQQVVLGERLAHDQRRHARGEPLPLLHRALEFAGVADTEKEQLWRAGGRQRIGQVRHLAHPGAMHHVAGVAQRAVDDLDGVLLPRQDHHWNGAVFAQNRTPARAGGRG